jgi:hypothetical protein
LESERVIETGTTGEDLHEVVFAYLTRDFEPADKKSAVIIKIIDATAGAQWFAPWPMQQPKPPSATAKAVAGKEQWPRDGESRGDFMRRCSAGLMAGGMSEDKAREVCAAKWTDARDRSV